MPLLPLANITSIYSGLGGSNAGKMHNCGVAQLRIRIVPFLCAVLHGALFDRPQLAMSGVVAITMSGPSEVQQSPGLSAVGLIYFIWQRSFVVCLLGTATVVVAPYGHAGILPMRQNRSMNEWQVERATEENTAKKRGTYAWRLSYLILKRGMLGSAVLILVQSGRRADGRRVVSAAAPPL